MEIILSTDSIVRKDLKLALENPNTSFTYDNVIKFNNIKRLYDFIKENLKSDFVNFEEVIKELLHHGYEKGWGHYELGFYETKSRNAEQISYEYTCDYVEDEVVNEIITF
ncbi:hypothetical protein [Bacillus pseudomycoides]|uniref:hypothetical protein n=1 Tax=Bacillus pseudomycoides TaxID=64104 RepID=UPI000501E633|nr:hypothetical protein [Bacillus pseudomycoides]KFN12798.1 putative regulatory domain protein [Bacillus pseudomycoides]MDR4188080.1 hypothetical protein [Bacillus pseudomycoides]MED0855699.1 hypothetical protein [Bacillus pseudomycoides]